jgi:hypothetical protein
MRLLEAEPLQTALKSNEAETLERGGLLGNVSAHTSRGTTRKQENDTIKRTDF